MRAEAKRMDEFAKLQARGAASSSAAGSGGPAPARKFVKRVATGYSLVQMKQFLPPFAAASKDDKRENRWRVREPYLQGERSKSYGSKSGLSDWEAMVWVLQLLWHHYTKTTGIPCPFEWETLQPVA